MSTGQSSHRSRLRWAVGGVTAVALTGALVACSLSQGDEEAFDASSFNSDSATATASDDSLTASVQEAAEAFVGLLDEDQLGQLYYDYDDADQKTVWSNLPVGSAGSTNSEDSDETSESDDGEAEAPAGTPPDDGEMPEGEMPSGAPGDGEMPSGEMPTGAPEDGEAPEGGAAPGGGGGVARNGLALEDMTEEQQEAALAVVNAFLSDQGLEQVEDIRAADDVLDEDNGGNSGWSSGLYFLAFFGDPTSSDTFFIQFGGHHMAINADFQGDDVSVSPEFIGIEPTEYTDDEGNTVEAMGGESSSLYAILDGLSEDQLAEAELEAQWSDLAKGAGDDGDDYPDDEYDGVQVSSLSQEQQDLVTEAIRQWVGDLDESVSEPMIEAYTEAYGETYVSWSISADADDSNSYVRISGPGVWIEYSHQPGIGEAGWHIHSVYRDKQHDYSAAG